MPWWWLALLGCGWTTPSPTVADPPADATWRVEHVTEPTTWWARSGFVRMVPPVPLPSSADDVDLVEVQLQLPEDGVVRVVDGPDGPVTLFPPGTTADRVEWRGMKDTRRVVDVRGTTVAADGTAWDHLYRPLGTTPEAPLLGASWPAQDHAARDAAVAWLAQRLAVEAPVRDGSTSAQERWRDSLLRKSTCTTCHVPLRPMNTRPGEHGLVARGTDASGWFTPVTVLADSLPVETYGVDRIASVQALTVRCGEQAATPDAGGAWRCGDGAVPVASLDMAQARVSDADHVFLLCQSRRFLLGHMSAEDRARFAAADTACDHSSF